MSDFQLIPFHPLSEIFPLIDGAEFEALVRDICANGIREPIILHEGAVLDGRNRYRALMELARTGELRGQGWGGYADEPITEEDLTPGGNWWPWFERYSPMTQGDPVTYVASKNLLRRHLTISQRAMLAADLGKLGWGGDRSKPSNDALTVERRAQIAQVGTASVERADVVKEHGIPELQDAVRRGDISVAPAAEIARMPEAEQPAAVQKHLPNGARAIMGSRHEPDDSLDYFPTPPWATRALMEVVWPVAAPSGSTRSAWEPACGEGHIAEVLREYFPCVLSSDIHDYGYGEPHDFLGEPIKLINPQVDWIITNPPFNEKAEAFVLKALERAQVGVAMFLRLQWLETNGRYDRIFKPHPPSLIAQFSERVPLCKGRWNPDGDTATAYLWIIWMPERQSARGLTEFFWIPPGQRDALTRPDDAERFTNHPVIKRNHLPPHDPETGEIHEAAE